MQTVEPIKQLFLQSGTGWVLWLLFGLSAASVAVFLERWLYFRSKTEDVDALAGTLDAHLDEGAYVKARELLAPMHSVGAVVARAGLKLAHRGPQAAEKGMQSAIAVERKRLEMRLTFLGTLGNNAPFVGLFGTVIGVILAFEELGRPAAAAASGSQVASAAVMSAIAEALVATAVGIAVALPAVAAYNYFQRRIAVLMDDAETLSTLVLAYLTTERTDAPSTEMFQENGSHSNARVPQSGTHRRPAGAA